jgi:shikimate kinase / 3-dehydroquinate synthase
MSHIYLYGPPGSGKSTLGKMLADSLRLPFIDVDQAMESRLQKPIPQIMEECGEQGFRDVESAVIREQMNAAESVIALGGGALLREQNRTLVGGHGTVICLTARPEVLLQRLNEASPQRPLLSGNVGEKLTRLLATRKGHYDSFAEPLDTEQTPEVLVQKLQSAVGRFHLEAMGTYDVIIQPNSLDRFGEVLHERGVAHPVVVTDQNVAQLHSEHLLGSLRSAGYDPGMLVIAPGESSKTLDTVNTLWRGFLQAGVDRKSTIIAAGGGVVGDLAGFAASTFMRGIDWIAVPTTLLAMVDASLGGKTGFDLPEGKNLVGSFHAPRLVLADPCALDTLPEIELRAGLAEVVKHGVIADPVLFDECGQGLKRVKEILPAIIRRAVAVKVRIIESDPYERGERTALNLGHTVGHAVEAVSGFRVRHGEAVAMGMVAEAKLAERFGIAAGGLSSRIAKVLLDLGLPVEIPEELPRPELVRAMYADKKKARGVLRFALPAEIGRMQLNVEVADPRLVFERAT